MFYICSVVAFLWLERSYMHWFLVAVVDPENTFEVFVDQTLVNSGSLLQDFEWVSCVIMMWIRSFTLQMGYANLQDIYASSSKAVPHHSNVNFIASIIIKHFYFAGLQWTLQKKLLILPTWNPKIGMRGRSEYFILLHRVRLSFVGCYRIHISS